MILNMIKGSNYEYLTMALRCLKGLSIHQSIELRFNGLSKYKMCILERGGHETYYSPENLNSV